MLRTLFLSILLLTACTKDPKSTTTSPETSEVLSTIDLCRKTPSHCSSVDIEKPEAKEAYQIGCDASDYYSCYRLGQFYETINVNVDEAVKAYTRSCSGNDPYGCKSEVSLRSKLCFIENKKEYCKGEPTGEYRILAFLRTSDSKYQDSFIDHNFSEPFTIEQVKTLYEKRITERSKKLLAALRIAKRKGKHDGANAESLQADIWRLEGNEKMLEETGN